MFESLYSYLEKDEVTKYLRLVIVVSCYLMFRGVYTKWAGQKQIQRQVEQDKREKAEKPERELAEREALREKLENEAASLGWGKKTRQNIKVSQQVLEQEANILRERHQTSYDAAEDHDIEDLLE